MSCVHSKNTKPELRVRKVLHRAGFRFRLSSTALPCKPDIILPKYKTVILVHGCFWHRHPCCKHATMPSSNVDYWEKKFQHNIERDHKEIQQLEDLGWRVIIVWECELKKPGFIESLPSMIRNATLRSAEDSHD